MNFFYEMCHFMVLDRPILTLYNVCVGVFSTVGEYHDVCGEYLEYRGGCSVPWGTIMMYVGDILSTVGDVQYCGECSVLWEDIIINVGDILTTLGCSVPWRIS